MNAMEAARSSQWKDSLSFRSSFRLPASTERAALFNAQLTLDPAFVDRVSKTPAAALAEYGFSQWSEHVPENLDKVQLSAEQRQQVADVLLSASIMPVAVRDDMLRALEGNLQGSMYAQPMLAVLVLAVAVVIVVFLWVAVEIP